MPDLSPEEEQIRRLLADARHTEPVPDDVAARLDGVLADLRAESTTVPPATSAAPAPDELGTDELAGRRRRRRAGTLLVAAAAVVAVGFGISRVGDLSSSGPADSSSAGGSAAESSRSDAAAGPAPFVLDPSTFDDDVATLVTSGDLRSYAAPPADSSKPLVACRGAGAGVRIPVLYDDQDAVLVVRPVHDGSREAVLYRCGESTPVRSTTVQVR